MNNKTEDVDLLVKGIISYLTKSKKLNLIPQVVEKLQAFISQQKNTAQVVTSYELDEEEKSKIESLIRSKFDNVAGIAYLVDEKILGGIIIKVKDKMMDLSLSGKLTKIEESIK